MSKFRVVWLPQVPLLQCIYPSPKTSRLGCTGLSCTKTFMHTAVPTCFCILANRFRFEQVGYELKEKFADLEMGRWDDSCPLRHVAHIRTQILPVTSHQKGRMHYKFYHYINYQVQYLIAELVQLLECPAVQRL